MRAVLIIAAAALTAASGAALLAPGLPRAADAAKASQPQGPKPPAVTVVQPERREIIAEVTVAGTLVPREEVMVAPEVDGLTVTEILVEEGDRVERGQVLAKLNRAALDVMLSQNNAQIARADAAIAQAKALIADADAQRQQAKSSLGRTQSLRATGFSTAEVFDQKIAASRSAEARHEQQRDLLNVQLADKKAIEAQREDVLLRMSRAEIKAPRAGIVSRKNAKLGAMAPMAGNPLFHIIADGAIELEAEVAEVDLARIRRGQPASVTPAGAAKPAGGTVRLVLPEVDKASRLGKLRIALSDSSGLAIGAFARASVETARRSGLTVPVSAITFARGSASVQAVVDGAVASRPVTVGLISGARAEIESGLAESDVIVARAGSFLRDGDQVRGIAAAGKP